MKNTWFQKLKSSLSKSSSSISQGITKIITSKRLDEATLQDLEDLLISADIGVDSSVSIIENLKKEKFNKDIDISEIKTFLADQIEIKLASSYKKLIFNKDQSPHIIIVVGVNGSGKTTTIAKLANNFKKDGAKVLIGAADTFRAAAIEQITSWASRLNIEIVASDIVKDAASIAYDTVKKAKDDKFDVAIIDTAGRLQNRSELMDELAKIIRVIKKQDTEAPHSIILTLDATAGQNAIQQAKVFNEIANITGLIITKLDGTAKAGYIISIAQEIGLPIHYIGIGESVDDLNDFDIKSFSRLIVGLD
ncbi:MAG: signal recognition particle-docking protein FtsY [Cellvibrionales bacterium TMED49]|jgi:fused signal recognition particle receptor|uniref:Signal recognition particle receptor FtsY n=1 Tax=PS1 clade bacterium TaxID=2175152 RepID=A0A368DRB3_9PROT|nr:signal recognition particle-docking protein FtsY [Rhodobiaceae bacterium]MAU86829.1 signal recognition particle-docking protein FtsY [Rhodobiaceae bacterium]OUT75039.1 MAG: signal recognition particle-docking protein FtsY [Rhizobiales bacterium TMED25]OUU40451.1 MAG: signal recognition particle-docking protein FtsY [Cellvibrionales bacterium TMED49]RCL74392.1 MAG: signal recognition particle-docking protein FtsY [PS1 clade bacterium]|tara:strand:- start:3460 stop:4380 length:921 start_codon:yes stop_codon:yes gene_type:complete